MLARKLLLPAVAAVTLALPAGAGAAPLTNLKVRGCQAGSGTRDRQARFYAQMVATPGSQRMTMRFTLYQRTPAGLQPVDTDGLLPWRRSRPGVRTYGYTQTVTGLQPGGAYVMGVEFRWIDSAGKVVRTRRRLSRACRQDGPLPNLTILGLGARAGIAPGTEVYAVQVANEGAAPALGIDVDMFVDGAQADTAYLDRLDPGEVATVHVTGPACSDRIRAVVDRQRKINETSDADNELSGGCPAPAP